MRRFRRRFKRPKRPYDNDQLEEGKTLKKTYGLRRKKEIWIAQNIVRGFRQRARELTAVHDPEQEKVLLTRLAKLGLLADDSTLDDVLGLTVEHVLDRRLQTLVMKKGFAKTPLQSRQSIVHGQVSIGIHAITFPSYLVPVKEEDAIVSSFTPPEPVTTRGQVAPVPHDASGSEESTEVQNTEAAPEESAPVAKKQPASEKPAAEESKPKDVTA